jgi:hypothetical protein
VSKLSKFLRDPMSFTMDSKLYRRMRVLRGRADSLLREMTGDARVPIGTGDAVVEQLLRELAKRVGLLDLSEPGSIEVAVLQADRCGVTEFLFDLSRKEGVSILLEAGRRKMPLAGAHLFAVDDFVIAHGSFAADITFAPKGETLRIVFQLWTPKEDHVVGPSPHPVARRIANEAVKDHRLFEPGPLRHVRELHEHRLVMEPDFPIDAVYTWVNHADPEWQRMRAEFGDKDELATEEGQSLDRFKNRDELRYSLRSIAKYAPWVRNVFIVTNCAPPAWVNLEHPKLRWVDHREILPAEALPTFSSHAIESRLHHIPGLANHFLYVNDDLFIARPATPGDFFFCTGMSKSCMEGYGVVNGRVAPEDPDYLNAARNGKRLLEERFGRSVTSLHTHSVFALRKDVLEDMSTQFREPIEQTTRRRFRTPNDISTVSFLYHHYAYLTGRGMYWPTDAMLLRSATPRYEGKLVKLLTTPKRPISICLNDGGGSAHVPHWDRHVIEFLEAYFPEPSAFERL